MGNQFSIHHPRRAHLYHRPFSRLAISGGVGALKPVLFRVRKHVRGFSFFQDVLNEDGQGRSSPAASATRNFLATGDYYP